MFKRYGVLIVGLLFALVVASYGATLIVRRFDKVVIGQGNPVTTGMLNLPAGTAATSGIYFGSDTNLYRSAANTLKTDDAVVLAGTLAVTGAQINTGALTVNGSTVLGDEGTDALTIGAATTATGTVALNGATTLGDESTDTITCTGRLIVRTLEADPLGGTAGDRPDGSVGEIGLYSNAIYLCTDASTPTWVKVGPDGT